MLPNLSASTTKNIGGTSTLKYSEEICMRFGVSAHGKKLMIAAKRNNWRPTSIEPELPDSIAYLAAPLQKVGDVVFFGQGDREYSLLAPCLKGQDPAERLINQAAAHIADYLIKEIEAACVRMRRQGIQPIDPEGVLLVRIVQTATEKAKLTGL